MTSKKEFLSQLPIFADLSDDELDGLVKIAPEFEFDDGAVIAYQRDVAHSLYIVRDGRLTARQIDRSGAIATESVKHYLPGDYFGEEWMFVPTIHPATIKAAGSGRLIIMAGDEFLPYLTQYPSALAKFEPEVDPVNGRSTGMTPEGWAEARKSRVRAAKRTSAVSLLPDELVEYESRRSLKYLILTELGLFLGLVTVPTLLFLLLDGRSDSPTWITITMALPILVLAIFAIIMLFRLLDWSNDYFIITNKHLAHREFDLIRLRIDVAKIPLHQIQSVETSQPNLLTNLLNIGTASIRTASQHGTIQFDNIDDPDKVQEVINRLTRRFKELDAAREQSMMRTSIENHFQVPPAYRPVKDNETAALPPAPPQPLRFWTRLRRRYQGRVVDGNVITYRKHFFVLLEQIAWPTAVGLLLSIIAYLLVRYASFGALQLGIVFFVFFLLDLGWLIWQIEDWSNDTFQVTDKFVIDIDRRPFGFGEQKKQASIDNVQNVNADRPGFLPTLFNYGHVLVETAGASANIVFENVANPTQVQTDIFQRLDQARYQRRIKESESRRKEYGVLLDVFKQATEQERIPRRTPAASENPEGEF